MMDIGGEEVVYNPNPNIIDTSTGTVDLSQLDLSDGNFVDFGHVIGSSTQESMQQVVQLVDTDTSSLGLSMYQPLTNLQVQEQGFGNNIFQMESENKDVTCQRQGQASPVQKKQGKVDDMKGEGSVTEELKNEVEMHFVAFPEKIPPVKVLRKVIPKMLMCCYANLNQKKVKGLWTDKKPEDWPESIPFKDPNNKAKGEHNQKPRREDLEAMYSYLKYKLLGTGMQQSDSGVKQGVTVQPQTPQYPVQVEDTGSNSGEQHDTEMPGKELVERIQDKMKFVGDNAGSFGQIFKEVSQHVMQLGENGPENFQFIKHGHNFEFLLDMYRFNKTIPDTQEIVNLFPDLPLSIQAEDYSRPHAEVQCRQEISNSVQEFNMMVEGPGETKLRDEPPKSPENFEEVSHPEMKVMMRQPAEQPKVQDAISQDWMKILGIQEHVFSGLDEDNNPVKGKEEKQEGKGYFDVVGEVTYADLMAVIKDDIKEEIVDDYEFNQQTHNKIQTEQEDVQGVAMSPGMADVTAQYDNMQIQSPVSEIPQAPSSPAKRKLDNVYNNTTPSNQPQEHAVQDQSDVSKSFEMFLQRMAQRQDQQVFVFGEQVFVCGEPGTQGQIPPMVAQLSDDEPAPQPCKKMRI